MFHHHGVPPKIIPLEILKEITNNFSKEQELGSGTFGTVYKGVKDGEEMAVKYLRTQGNSDHEKFKDEFENLWKLRHPNIVQLLGYCYEIKREIVQLDDGRHVWADNIYRALCFEYMHNRSLGKHISDEDSGHDWQTRYKIIKGICDGLKYLHEGLSTPMYHLDLKPDNILLDKNMVPKLADFGLSKLMDNNQTQATESIVGTRGFLPPEYIKHNLVSNKFDIFSLGVVMIMIITGKKGYFKKADMSSQQFINLVYERWRSRIHATSGCTTPEAKCHQVRVCIKIAVDCVNSDRAKRPTIGDIVLRLNQLEPRISAAPARPQQTSVAEGPKDTDTDMPSPGFCKQLDDPTPALQFPFPLVLDKGIQCHGILTDRYKEVNKIDGVRVSQINLDKEQGNVMVSGLMDSESFIKKPNKDVNSQLKKLHLTRGAKGQPTDAGAKDRKNGVCNTDAKTVLPQPMVQQPQQTLMKELKAPPQQPKLISPKKPFEVAVPVKGPKSVEFNAPPDEDIDDSMFYGLFNIPGEEHSGIFESLLDTKNDKEVFKTGGFYEQKLVTMPLAMPLGANGADNNGANGGSEMQAQIKGNGNNAVKKKRPGSSAKPTVLPQPTLQQPQQTLMKELKAPPQHPKLISPKKPFAVAVPVKGPKSVEFNAPPDVDIDDDSMFYGLFNIDDDTPEEDSAEEHSGIFDGLLDTKNVEVFKTGAFYEQKMVTMPLTMPLGANGVDNNGANGGSEMQAQIKENGNNAVKKKRPVSSAKQNQGSCHGTSGGGRQMQNVNDVALGLAGFPATCQQTGGGSVDRSDTSSVQHGSGGVVGAAMGMPVRGMPLPAPGFYQQGCAAARTGMPTGQAILQDTVAAAGNTMAARQQHMAPAQQPQQPKVSRNKKMQ